MELELINKKNQLQTLIMSAAGYHKFPSIRKDVIFFLETF